MLVSDLSSALPAEFRRLAVSHSLAAARPARPRCSRSTRARATAMRRCVSGELGDPDEIGDFARRRQRKLYVVRGAPNIVRDT
jgi:hypothetical protein